MNATDNADRDGPARGGSAVSDCQNCPYAVGLTEAARAMLAMIRGSDFDGLSWSEYLGDEGAAVLSALASAVASCPLQNSRSGVDDLKIRRSRAIGTPWDIAPTRHANTGGKGECDICRQMVGAWLRWNCAQVCEACWQASTPERWSWSAAATAAIPADTNTSMAVAPPTPEGMEGNSSGSAAKPSRGPKVDGPGLFSGCERCGELRCGCGNEIGKELRCDSCGNVDSTPEGRAGGNCWRAFCKGRTHWEPIDSPSISRPQRGRDSLERVAQAMIRCGLTTGHGDTLDDLLRELEEQVRERRNPKDTARIEWLAERRVIVEEIGRPNVPLFTVQSSVIALRECIDAEAPEIHRIGQEP